MVFGNVVDERIQLNEDSLWSGGPRDRTNPDACAAVPSIRQLLREGRLTEAQTLACDALSGIPDSQRNYEPLADLLLTFLHPETPTNAPDDYQRELDLHDGIARVSYRWGALTCTREHLISYPDQVMAIRVTADHPGGVSVRARVERGPRNNYASRYADAVQAQDGCALLMTGQTGGAQGIDFALCVRAVAEGGAVHTCGETLIVEGADAVVLLLASATSYREEDPASICCARVTRAQDKGWERLLDDHLREYRGYFDRVDLDFGETDGDDIPTDARLQRVQQGGRDAYLDALYFHYGRYLLIAASRPGSLPANLQGIWNEEFSPPWGCKYTININAQMNYWPAEVCNLPELATPLFDLIETMREPGRRMAQRMYGCRGFVCHHNTDLWGDCAPTDRNLTASFWPMGAAWLCLHLWEHYAFTGDRDFLGQVYGTLKEACLFFLDFLVEDARGRLVTSPTVSAENTYRLANGEQGSLCMGASMDNQMLDRLFQACCHAATILDVDDDFRTELEDTRRRLPQPAIGQYGQLMEWPEDYDEVEPGHRHISHLFALHPGNQISPLLTPELAQAARRTLERRLQFGGGHTGWSRAWIINFWARLLDGEQAYANVQALLAQSTYPNLFDNHPPIEIWTETIDTAQNHISVEEILTRQGHASASHHNAPFQIDGNFGGAAGIVEMLVQSQHGEIHLLPALPDAWPNGQVKGLRARGNYRVDLVWRDGALARAAIHAESGGLCQVRYQDRLASFELAAGETIDINGMLSLTDTLSKV
jgi:alpha-L-fucosidase 2